MINAPSVTLQKKSCITSFSNAPIRKSFSSWWFELVKENITMTLKDILLGLLNRTDIINYLIILGKLCIWECRKANIHPDFNIFLKKVKIKFKTEKNIANKNRTFENFRKRWEAILAKLL